MSQHLLDRPEVRAVFQQMRREGMAKSVGGDILVDMGLGLVGFDDLPEPLPGHPLSIHVDKKGLLIVTGDLGSIGHQIVRERFLTDGVDLGVCFMDCGMLIFDPAAQDVHAGGSGCGCSASVLCGHLLARMREGCWPRLLFCATGALLSTTSAQQGESIPGICHAVALEMDRGC